MIALVYRLAAAATARITQVAIAPSGDRALTLADPRTLTVFGCDDGAVLARRDDLGRARFAGDGQHLEVVRGRRVLRIEPAEPLPADAGPPGLGLLSPDGAFVLELADRQLARYDREGALAWSQHSLARTLAVSADGRVIVALSFDPRGAPFRVAVLDAATQRSLGDFPCPRGAAPPLAVSDDGAVLALGAPGGVALLALPLGTAAGKLALKGAPATSLAFRGGWLFAGDAAGALHAAAIAATTARPRWDAATDPIGAAITALAATDDATLVAAGCVDGTGAIFRRSVASKPARANAPRRPATATSSGRLALPEIPSLGAASKLLPSVAVALEGDELVAAFGALKHPLTLVRFAGGASTVRTYPATDLATALPPGQLVAAAGALWLVHAWGHARVDRETLGVEPVAGSAVKYLVPLPSGEVLAASGARFSSVPDFQRFVRADAARLSEPLLRSQWGLTQNASDWAFVGAPFPAGDPATALTDGLARLLAGGRSALGMQWATSPPDGDRTSSVVAVRLRGLLPYFHASSAVVVGAGAPEAAATLVLYGRELQRASIYGEALVALDLARAEVTRYVPAAHPEPVRLALAGGALLGLGARSVVRIDPDTLAMVDRAQLPAGLSLFAGDATRLVALDRRARALVLVDAAPFAGPLADAVAVTKAATKRALAAT